MAGRASTFHSFYFSDAEILFTVPEQLASVAGIARSPEILLEEKMREKNYIAIVQCALVKQRCSGYLCEKAFHERTEGFAAYSPDKAYRTLYLTCGGCCGRPLHRKLSNLIHKIRRGRESKRIRSLFSFLPVLPRTAITARDVRIWII